MLSPNNKTRKEQALQLARCPDVPGMDEMFQNNPDETWLKQVNLLINM